VVVEAHVGGRGVVEENEGEVQDITGLVEGSSSQLTNDVGRRGEIHLTRYRCFLVTIDMNLEGAIVVSEA
jgi:hypothetical protein